MNYEESGEPAFQLEFGGGGGGNGIAPLKDLCRLLTAVDFASPMLDELDNAAQELNISRQALIKTLIRQALDHHYLATARQSAVKQR